MEKDIRETSEYALKNVWIGLLKAAEHNDDIVQFELLLDFLHYIAGRCKSPPIYRQMLKSIVRTPEVPVRSAPYPSFTGYQNIDETSVVTNRIEFAANLRFAKRSTAVQAIENCFAENQPYRNQSLPWINPINTLMAR